MIDLTGVTHHPAVEEIVDVLCAKTQNTDRGFFHAEVAYFLGKIASNMRACIVTKDRGTLPVNMYVMALATSGFGKNHSVGIMENEFLRDFQQRYVEDTLPTIAEMSLWGIANNRAARNGTEPKDEFDAASAEYKRVGPFVFSFDSGTTPAVKQLRHKLLMANSGAINLQIDEIGSNIIGETEVLTTFLELYDQGVVKQKLTKHTSENLRGEELIGKTPANMLLFGTPAQLLDGGQTEERFYSLLETGYARRCIFGFGQATSKAFNTQTPEEIFRRLTLPANDAAILKWSSHFHSLADPALHGWKITVPDPVAIKLLEYKIACEREAEELPEHDDIRKAELGHRYFKALKLAGAYAFVDMVSEMEMDHLLQAILLVEEAGTAFQKILTREKAYVKLAKYIADINTEVTHADLLEALPFYKSTNAGRTEQMMLATAWGYKQHIIIKKTFLDGIEFFRGEKLQETDLSKLMLSHSDHWAYNYQSETAPFDQLHMLTQLPNYHWANHSFRNGHRAEENVIGGFNMVVVDVDGGVDIATAHELLREYKFMTYTTKRHTEEANRFRLILPINYHLNLDADDYREFMEGVTSWLPFPIDDAANQRSRKWECFAGGSYFYNHEGALLDALHFIPKTSKNEQYRASISKIESMDNLERWFATRMATGNRNNNMARFAFALIDSGLDLVQVTQHVHDFNNKLANPLPKAELETTVLASAAKHFLSP
jgi:hypothetical protein